MDAKFIEETEAESVMQEINVQKEGIDIMIPKAKFRLIRVTDVDPGTANIIKQSMLSAGGDAAVAVGTVSCKVEKTDVLLMGTISQYREALPKLKYNVRDCPKVAELIEKLLEQ
jgi:dihydropteroate synthase